MRHICCCLVIKSCLTLCNPMDCNLPASSVRRISQAWILECDAISFSKRSSRPRDWTLVSCVAGGFSTIWATSFWLDSFKFPRFPFGIYLIFKILSLGKCAAPNIKKLMVRVYILTDFCCWMFPWYSFIFTQSTEDSCCKWTFPASHIPPIHCQSHFKTSRMTTDSLLW